MAGSIDINQPLEGYYPSHWPCECAGPRRQKLTTAPGLNLQPGERLVTTQRDMSEYRWPTMFVCREPGEIYLQGGTQAFMAPRSFGWVERIDPITLKTLARSPDLPSGGHNWCGAATVHANGDLYVVNGRYAHRLDPDLNVVAETKLRNDNAHNGHVIMPDGNLVTKDMQIDSQKRSLFTVLDPDLHEISTFEAPFASVGRFSCDPQNGFAYLYTTSSTRIARLIYKDGRITLDPSWSACYDIPDQDQSFAWDSTVALGSVWFMDMGENDGVARVLNAHPIGTLNSLLGKGMRFLDRVGVAPEPSAHPLGRPTHSAPQRVFRVSVDDAADMSVLVPFNLPSANIIAPPLVDPTRRILVAFDGANAKVGAWRYSENGELTAAWKKDFVNSSQMTVFADTGELLVDDVHDGRWDAVVLDIETGAEKGRADTRCVASSGMWYTPGFNRDVYVSTIRGGIARVAVE